MNKVFLPILATFCFILLVGFLITSPNQIFKNDNSSKENSSQKVIKIKDVEINVFIADSSEKRASGLSNKENLDEKEGMLFIFDKKDIKPTFWMKDMLFSYRHYLD
ncbi:DUF192 domain-containing protein [Patescibacteria group bacterium]